MTALFERALGTEWTDLHPATRERHDEILENYELFDLGGNRVTNAKSHCSLEFRSREREDDRTDYC